MERFLNIDWRPPLNDLIDDVFIHDERLEEESVMYKIMRGNFADPFEDIENDYNDVNIDLINEFEGLKGKSKCAAGTAKSNCNNEGENQQSNVRTYVPGIVKPSVTFPRSSHLSKEQHATCLKVLLTFSASQKAEMTQSNRDDLETYYKLKDIITKEQDEYLELAKSNWDGSKLKVICEDYINARWKEKMQRINRLPRYYVETSNIPFIGNQKVNVTFLTTCLQLGSLRTIELPTLKKPFMMRMHSEELETKYPVSCSQLNKPLVSEDPLCENLAVANDVDLVISSSGLYTLFNNIGSNYLNSWILPVIVKAHNNKNTVYIDKPVPPTTCTVPEKNIQVYKHILKYYLLGSKNCSTNDSTLAENVADEENIFGNVNSDDLLKLEEDEEHCSQGGTTIKCERIKEEMNDPQFGTNENVDGSHCGSGTVNTDSKGMQSLTADQKVIPKGLEAESVSYNLFTLSPQFSEQNEFMKNNVVKQYKILVRSKIDGVEKCSEEDDVQLLMIAPKLEHQVGLGAEAITLNEGLKQWAMLTFRPGASLARVRISAQTSEVLQIERRTAISVNRELRRLYNVNVEDTLTILYNVIQELTNAPPNRYIIRHTVRNGAFAAVYKEVDKPDKNTFDLHTISGTPQFCTIPTAPWPMLDKVVTTPMLKCFERMPCMYYPPKSVKTGAKRKFKRNANAKGNIGGLRKSLRNKRES